MDIWSRELLERVVAEVEEERATGDVLREHTKRLDRAQRVIVMQLNLVHSMPSEQVGEHLRSVYPLFDEARAALADCAAQVPPQQYYKWNDVWTWPLRNLVFAACLTYFLGTGGLLSKEDAARVLGMAKLPSDRMMLATDEYLHGIISMVNELPRLAVNAVTVGDFAAPLRISTFVKQLHSAFQVLNLKNDALRKRFDGMKYDVKRIEEIIYDISLRGLAPRSADVGHNASCSSEQANEVLARLCGAS